MTKTKVLIMGAAGRDFHNFNTFFRDNEAYEVVAFTATQIPNIAGRKYPPELAGRLYPAGIPIYPEADLTDLIKQHDIDQVIFAYSDVSHAYVMHKASQVLAAGADYRLMGPKTTQIKSIKPVVSIGAVRTGAGKSQTTRRVTQILKDLGYKVVAIRHPMPYGDLAREAVQRFATRADLDAAAASGRRAETQRDFMALTPPADGLIIRRDGEIGQFIPAGQAVFYLSCCAPLRVTAEVDEEDISRVHIGQKVVLRADALPGEILDGHVSEITPKGDPVARSYRVRVALADPSRATLRAAARTVSALFDAAGAAGRGTSAGRPITSQHIPSDRGPGRPPVLRRKASATRRGATWGVAMRWAHTGS